METGQVIAHFGKHFLVENEQRHIISCISRGKKAGIACGDYVSYEILEADKGMIHEVQDRKNLLYRSDQFRQKVLASNVTQILFVLASEPSFYEELLNRALINAEFLNIKILVVLNKCDLETKTAEALKILELYQHLGYEILTVSAEKQINLDALVNRLKDETSILVGQSGMGKSSLINAIFPEDSKLNLRTREISKSLDSGKHTTTHSQLYHLDFINKNSHIIDSPGLQEFGLKHLTLSDFTHAFPEFRDYLGECRFQNCKHLKEPDCAIKNAQLEGKINERRLATYQRLALEF